MIVKTKRKTRLINGGDGVDHSESYEKNAPGYHSSGYSYSSSTTKTFATPAFANQMAQQEENNEQQNAQQRFQPNKNLMAGGIVAGGAAGWAGRKVAGGIMKSRAQNQFNKTVTEASGKGVEALNQRASKPWYKRIFGPSEKTINSKVGKQITTAQSELQNKLTAASGGGGKWAMIGAGITAAGIGAHRYWRNKQAQQQQA